MKQSFVVNRMISLIHDNKIVPFLTNQLWYDVQWFKFTRLYMYTCMSYRKASFVGFATNPFEISDVIRDSHSMDITL